MTSEKHLKNVYMWREEMDDNLRRENGWLALAGLFWLRQGKNIVGSAPDADILLPKRAPAKLGVFEFDGSNVAIQIEASLPVEINGVEAKSAALSADEENVPSFITFDNMRMVVVRRSKGVGIRLWDNTREDRNVYPPREWYAVKDEYLVPATYTKYETPQIVKMPDILGSILDEQMHGYVSFELNGQQRELMAQELPDRRLFIQFMDETNNQSTYPSGRYHHTDPHENGSVFIDFNKAYSPPCSFTEYATCTFPPQENHLQTAVEAGELYTDYQRKRHH